MHKELEVMKPRCNGLWKRCAGTAALIYFWMLANVPTVAFAADKGKSNATDVSGVGCIHIWGMCTGKAKGSAGNT